MVHLQTTIRSQKSGLSLKSFCKADASGQMLTSISSEQSTEFSATSEGMEKSSLIVRKPVCWIFPSISGLLLMSCAQDLREHH